MAKKKEEKKEEKPKKQKTSKSVKKYLLKDLFKKTDIDDDEVTKILEINGIFESIETADIKLTESEFNEVIDNYKRGYTL